MNKKSVAVAKVNVDRCLQPVDWTIAEVTVWLKKNGLESLIVSFEQQKVDGATLLSDIDEVCLDDMNCCKLHSKKLLRLIEDLKQD